MKISFLEKIFPKKKKAEVFYLLGLIFLEKEVKCALIEKVDGKRKIVGVARGSYGGDWDKALETVDKAVSEACKLVSDEKVDEVILGVPSYWTTEGKILKEYLFKMRKIFSELDLRPIGFVTIIEGLIFWLQKKEGVPLTGIILGFFKDKIEINLVKAGKIEGTKLVEKEKGKVLGVLVEGALLGLKKEGVLPTRIILYGDATNLEEIKEELISYPFVDKNIFLHIPRVEICKNNEDLRGLISSAGISLPEGELSEEEEEESEKFGFVVGKDIGEVDKKEEKLDAKEEEIEKKEGGLSLEEAEKEIEEKEKAGFDLGVVGEKVKKEIAGFFEKKEMIKDFLGKRALFLIIIGGLLLGGGVFGFFYLPRAEMTVFVEQKVLEHELEIYLTTDKKKTNEDTLLVESVKVEEKGERTKETTGKKVVGEKAKGEVVVYNKTTTGEKKFDKGTIISYQGIDFLLNEEAVVASASAGLESLTFGKKEVGVTAAEIGEEGNLGAGKTFSVADYPKDLYSAYNNKAFSGGSSREIKVVSEEDKEELLEKLTNQLVKKGKKTLLSGQDEGKEGKILIDKGVKTEVLEEKYSGGTGDEARELKLNLKIKIEGIAVDKKELDEFLQKKVKKDVPSGYELEKEKFKVEIVEVGKEEKERTPVKIYCQSFLMPEIDVKDLKEEIKGRRVEDVRDYLERMTNVVGFEANIYPQFWYFKSHFPYLTKKIEVKVELYK